MRFAVPDEADRLPNATVALALESYSFSQWSWEGHPGWDVLVLLAMALAARLLSFGLIVSSKKLQFS